MIKFIVAEHYSETDINGNRYWGTMITSTVTGYSFTYSDNTNNAAYHVKASGYEWDNIYHYEIGHPKKEFKAMTKEWPYMNQLEIESNLNKLEPIGV